MPYLHLLVTEAQLIHGAEVDAVYELAPGDWKLAPEDFVQRVANPMVYRVCDLMKKREERDA